MSLAAPAYQPPPTGLTRGQTLAGLLALLVVTAAAGLLVGRAARTRRATDPIGLIAGIPVGIDQSAAGALAAADDYLALEQQTVERDPSRFARLVALDYAPSIRSATLAAGQADRQSDPQGMALWAAAGRSFTVIGAHRLDYYRGDTARVSSWAGEIYWGPHQQPEQVWRLGEITLRWVGGRWTVSAMRTLPASAPSPASTPQAGTRDDTTAVFDGLLRGFSPVGYEAPGT